MSRRYNLRTIKSQHSYSAKELAQLLRLNISTIRLWVKRGLKPIDQRLPQLFLGSQVASFLKDRANPRMPLQPGELYCLSCKAPRLPRHRVVHLIPRSPTTADFVAPCADCGTRMFRRVRQIEIPAKLGDCTVALEDDRITMSSSRAPDEVRCLEGVVA